MAAESCVLKEEEVVVWEGEFSIRLHPSVFLFFSFSPPLLLLRRRRFFCPLSSVVLRMDCVPRGFFCDFSPPPFPIPPMASFITRRGKRSEGRRRGHEPLSLMFSLKLDSLCSFPDLEERVGVLPPLLIEAIGLHFTPLSSERCVVRRSVVGSSPFVVPLSVQEKSPRENSSPRAAAAAAAATASQMTSFFLLPIIHAATSLSLLKNIMEEKTCLAPFPRKK